MIVREFKKLYGNIASLRDYEVPEGVKAGGIVFKYRDQKMTLSAAQLQDKKFACHGKYIPSKIPSWRNPLTGQNGYRFVDFVFKPDEEQGKDLFS